MPNQTPNVFTRRILLTTTGAEFSLGFEGESLRFVNRSAVPVTFRLSSSTSTAGDTVVDAGDPPIEMDQLPAFSGFGLLTSSTTSSTSPGQIVDVTVWGG